MTLDVGDVALVPFPYTDLSSRKQRPALVLTPASYNRHHADVLAAYVTSRRQESRWVVRVDDTDLAHGRFPRTSWVRADKLATLEQRLVRRVVARLDHGTMGQVRARLAKLLGLG